MTILFPVENDAIFMVEALGEIESGRSLAMVLFAARFVVVSIDLWPQDLRDKFYCEHSRIRTASRVIRLDNADLAAMVDRR